MNTRTVATSSRVMTTGTLTFLLDRGDPALHGEVSEEGLDLEFGGKEVGAGSHAVEAGKSSDPPHIGALGMDGVMLEPEDPPDLLDQGRWGDGVARRP